MQPKLMKIGVDSMRAEQEELDGKIQKLVEDYLETHGKAPKKTSDS